MSTERENTAQTYIDGVSNLGGCLGLVVRLLLVVGSIGGLIYLVRSCG